MTAQYPTNVVTTTDIPNFNPLDTLSADNHAGRHNDLRDEVIALEAKVGANSSAVQTSHDFKLSLITTTDKATPRDVAATVTNKTLSTGTKILLGSDATGDTYYNGGSGTTTRVGIGSVGQVLTSNGSAPTWSSPSGTNVNYVVDTGAANAYVATLVPALGAYTAGVLVQFKATNANTTTSTVNVNGLGVKTIKKLGGATDLVSGDIAAGMVVELEYDGTNFLMLNPVANAPVTSSQLVDVQVFSAASSTSWTKPSGAKVVEVTVIGGGGAGGSGTANANSSGGGGGSYGFKKFQASVLGATESIVIGAGGVAGANNTAGGAGGSSSFGTTTLLKANGGAGGSSTAASGGAIGNGDIRYAGGNSNINGGTAVDTVSDPAPRGGGAGGYNGGVPATATAGGNGGAFTTNYVKAGGVGGAAGVNNGAAAASTSTGLFYGGVGGGGGGYNGNGTNTGGNGGAGNLGGGGGGSCGTNNTGGNGGDGCIWIVTYF